MPDTLPVHVNRTSLHSLEVPTSFETDDSFEIRLINHGEPIHVHLHLDDDLSDLAAIDATNHYVDGETQRSVGVSVIDEGAVFGKLKVVTGYGAETRYVDVEITESEEEQTEVQVDESLAQPQPDPEADPDPDPSRPAWLETPVYLLGGVALVVAVAAAILVPETPVRIGAAVVALSVIVGLYVAVTE